MSNIRKKHVGKSKIEKELYTRMLRTQQREDPTYDEYDSNSTDSVVKQETGKSSITEPALKPYTKESLIQWKEIIIGVIIFGITTILFLFGMSLNREMGVLSERSENVSKKVDEISKDVKDIENRVNDINLEVQIIKNVEKNKTKNK